jgi:hypothetical protein
VAVVRFCFVRLAEPEVARRAAHAARVRAVLAALGVDGEVGEPADASAARWDLSIVVRCASLDAWQALAATPALATLLDHELPAVAVVVKAWTFAVP